MALTPGYVGGTLAQRTDLAGQRARARAITLPAVLGGLFGAGLLLLAGEDLFEALVPWLLLVAAVLIGADRWLKRWVTGRIAAHDAAGGGTAPAAIAAFVGSTYGGFFGAGLGIILLALYAQVVPESLARINALKQLTSFLANVTAAAFLLFSGKVVWSAAAVMAVGALAGGVLAGRYVRRAHPSVLRGVVVAIAVVVALVYLLK